MGGARFAIAAIAAAGTLTIASAVEASSATTVRLKPTKGSTAKGTAVLRAAGGGTRAAFVVAGLKPHAAVRAVMMPGACSRPLAAAKAASIGTGTAGAGGTARWAANITRRGHGIALTQILSHGPLSVRIVSGSKTIACGLTPAPR